MTKSVLSIKINQSGVWMGLSIVKERRNLMPENMKSSPRYVQNKMLKYIMQGSFIPV